MRIRFLSAFGACVALCVSVLSAEFPSTAYAGQYVQGATNAADLARLNSLTFYVDDLAAMSALDPAAAPDVVVVRGAGNGIYEWAAADEGGGVPSDVTGFWHRRTLNPANNLSEIASPSVAAQNLAVPRYVATFAGLASEDGATGPLITVVRGFSAAGDGGGGVFTWCLTVNLPAWGTTNITGIVVTNASGGWVRDMPGDINALWCGVNIADGTATSDHTALNTAVWIASVLGRDVYCPAGVYNVKDWAPAYNVRLYGEPGYGAHFKAKALNDDGIVTTNTLTLENLKFTGFRYALDGAYSSTTLPYVDGAVFTVRKCQFEDNGYGAAWVAGTADVPTNKTVSIVFEENTVIGGASYSDDYGALFSPGKMRKLIVRKNEVYNTRKGMRLGADDKLNYPSGTGFLPTDWMVLGATAICEENIVRDLLPTADGDTWGLQLQASPIVFRNNQIRDIPTTGTTDNFGVYSQSQNVLVTGNVFHNAGEQGFWSKRDQISGATVSGNTFSGTTYLSALRMASDTYIVGNNFRDVAASVALIELTPDLTVARTIPDVSVVENFVYGATIGPFVRVFLDYRNTARNIRILRNKFNDYTASSLLQFFTASSTTAGLASLIEISGNVGFAGSGGGLGSLVATSTSTGAASFEPSDSIVRDNWFDVMTGYVFGGSGSGSNPRLVRWTIKDNYWGGATDFSPGYLGTGVVRENNWGQLAGGRDTYLLAPVRASLAYTGNTGQQRGTAVTPTWWQTVAVADTNTWALSGQTNMYWEVSSTNTVALVPAVGFQNIASLSGRYRLSVSASITGGSSGDTVKVIPVNYVYPGASTNLGTCTVTVSSGVCTVDSPVAHGLSTGDLITTSVSGHLTSSSTGAGSMSPQLPPVTVIDADSYSYPTSESDFGPASVAVTCSARFRPYSVTPVTTTLDGSGNGTLTATWDTNVNETGHKPWFIFQTDDVNTYTIANITNTIERIGGTLSYSSTLQVYP